MNLMTIFTKFPDQEACIEYLERVRWGDEANCPHCGSLNVGRKDDSGRVGRWNCHACNSSFNVLSGTIFEKTRIPLQKWFLAIGLIVNAKKSLSSFQLARDLDMNQKSAWYMQQRIRAAMLTEEGELLQGIIEADETYVGGKPRKTNRRDDNSKPNKRGRGTKKLSEDFADVREAEFPGDTRKMLDFRRSGSVEAVAGGVKDTALSAKLANSLSESKKLEATYVPARVEIVRTADAARRVGRAKLR